MRIIADNSKEYRKMLWVLRFSYSSVFKSYKTIKHNFALFQSDFNIAASASIVFNFRYSYEVIITHWLYRPTCNTTWYRLPVPPPNQWRNVHLPPRLGHRDCSGHPLVGDCLSWTRLVVARIVSSQRHGGPVEATDDDTADRCGQGHRNTLDSRRHSSLHRRM